jgi:hypothetical protein
MATHLFYDKFVLNQFNGGAVDFDTNTMKVALCTSSYTPDLAAHDFFDDITNEVSHASYTAGGYTLANVSLSSATPVITFDNTVDPAWTTATFTARYAILYQSTGTASTSRLVSLIDLGGDQTVSAATLTLVLNASGIFTVTKNT